MLQHLNLHVFSPRQKKFILNTDASDWDSASTTSKNLPVYKPEEEMKGESSAPLPIVQEHVTESVTEPQEAANTEGEEGKESFLFATRPLPSPRSFKPRTSTQPKNQPQTHINKESIRKPMSDEGERELCLFKPRKHAFVF